MSSANPQNAVIIWHDGTGAQAKGSITLDCAISETHAINSEVTDQQARFRGHYALGDHVITAGYEWERLDTFDLFVQDATPAMSSLPSAAKAPL